MSSNQEKKNRIVEFAARVAVQAQESGLTWDEAVASFGVASKTLGAMATAMGDSGDCIAHAKKRLEEGFEQTVSVKLMQLEEDPEEEEDFPAPTSSMLH
jgi:hypothetical protein